MFRITEDPSSGSLVQCLAKITKNGSIVSIDMDKVGVMAAHCDPLCVCVVHCIGRSSYTCQGTFKYFIILILSTNYILCICWIIKYLSLMHGANMKKVASRYGSFAPVKVLPVPIKQDARWTHSPPGSSWSWQKSHHRSTFSQPVVQLPYRVRCCSSSA